MSKQATITLGHGMHWFGPDGKRLDQPIDGFTVEKITDSVEYLPGSVLMKDEVERLCKNGAWKVIIQQRKH